MYFYGKDLKMELNNKNTHKYYLGIFSWFGFVLPFPERLRQIKEAGFDAVTIWWEDEIGNNLGYCNVFKEEMPQMVRDNGLYLDNVHLPYENCDDFWSESGTVRENIVNKHLKWLEDCAKFDVPVAVMHITDRSSLPDAPSKNGINSLEKIVRKAEELKIKLAVENISRPDYLDCVFWELQSEYLGFCYDSSHDWLYSKNKTELLKKWKHILNAIHLSDNDGIFDRHWLPGEGIVNWNDLAETFSGSFHGCLTLEVFPKSDEKIDHKNFLKNAYKRVRDFEKQILKAG
jgi:sugar phosphate isomerase/epimerase